MHRLPTTHRTYGRTYVSSRSTRDLDLWAQVEAEERLRQQQEREEQERIAKEEEERRRRKKERKREKREKEEREEREREREERELQEGQIVENDGDDAEEGVEGVTEEMSKLEIDGGEDVDEVERQIMAEIARGQLEKVMMEETDGGNILEEEVVLPIVDTPLTSPEKEEGEDHEKTEETAGMIEATPAPTQALEPQTPPRKQLRRESVVPTTPLTLREVDVSVVVQGAESPHVELHAQSSEEDERETDEETVIRSRLLSPEPLKEVLLTPERRGGLRRRSSRITLTGGSRRTSSALPSTVGRRETDGWKKVEEKEEHEKVRERTRLSAPTVLQVLVSPVKVPTSEYIIPSDGEEESEKEQAETVGAGGSEAGQQEQAHGGEEEQRDGTEREDGREGDEEWHEDPTVVTHAQVQQVLALCTVPEVVDFTAHINRQLKASMLTKLGEASYSEVFLQKPKSPTPTSPNTVLKIIPFGKQSQCLFSHIYEEILITRTMSPLKGYIGFHGAHVCRGKFPKKLLELWDHWDENVKVSENDRPDFYEEDQLFAVIGLEDGGTDLESFKVGGWREARQIFWAVAGALERGEMEREFEHRDLHFGNIVIRHVPIDPSPEQLLRNLSLGDTSATSRGGRSKSSSKKQPQQQSRGQSRLQVSLIDYTLSRARCENGVLSFTPLDDQALFEGKGDYQFDIYRYMRALFLTHTPPPPTDPSTGIPNIDWSVHDPKTNVYWLHYLLNILLNKKKELKKPPIASSSSRSRTKAPSSSAGWSEEEVAAYKELEWLHRGLDKRKKRFTAGSSTAGEKVVPEVGSAGELVRWARKEAVVKDEDL